MRRVLAIALSGAAFVLAACNGSTNTAGASLVSVEALPAPKLPSWIAEISPTKPAQTLAQVRVIFSKPVTTVGALEGNGPADILSHVRLEPDLKGQFVILTPRMIGFVPEQALPIGTRVRITLTAGLHDLAGDTLDKDLAWTFQTSALVFSDLPRLATSDDESPPLPSSLNPTLKVTANAAVNVESLAAHAALSNGELRIPVDAKLEVQPTPLPGSGAQEAFDPSFDTWIYDLTPRQALAKGTTYRLVIDSGVAPAYGNLPTVTRFTGQIQTYAPLAVTPTPIPSPGSGSGRFADGDPVVQFNNPLDPKSIPGAIHISDSAGHEIKATADVVKMSDGSPNIVTIDPYQLSPHTTYRITVASSIADIFGQTLRSPQDVSVRTGGFAAGFWAPSGTNIFPSDANVALNFYATNVPGQKYRSIFKPATPGTLVSTNDPSGSSMLPDSKAWPLLPIRDAKPDIQSVIAIPLRERLGGMTGALAFGASADLGGGNVPNFTGIIQLTNLGIFVQTFPNRVRVLVAHLSDGTPVPGAPVVLYRTGDNFSTTPCATGSTDATGEFDLTENTNASLAVCYAGNREAGTAPSIMAVASQGGDWAYEAVNAWDGIYQYNVDGTWSNGQPLSVGTVFTDRQMYQPGERARITGIAYYVRNGQIVADRNARYAVRLEDPSGTAKALGSVQTDAHGVFSMPLSFGANQALGYYTIDAKGESGNDISGQLRVAEFKPPNFKLDVTLAPLGIAGSQVAAKAQAAYLFGAPLSGGTAKVTVTRDVASLAPAGWDEYSFGKQWFWPDQQPSFDTDVLETNGVFDKTGAFAQSIPVPSDLPFPMTYSVDIQAGDVSNLTVDTSQTFTALATDGIIGLKSDLVGESGKPMDVQAVVTTLSGAAQSGRRMHLELQKMTYSSATQLVEGGEQPQNAVTYATVDTADIQSGDKPVTVALHPTDAGPYRIRANFSDAKNDASETDLQAFFAGSGEVNRGAQDTTTAQIKLDKKRYLVGDTATAVVTSPFPKSDVYFAVVRQDVIEKTIVHADGNGPKISFKITPAMLPNAAVEAVVVRRGQTLRTVKPGSLDSLSRVGVVGLHVDLGDRYIKVGIQPQSPTLEPGMQQHVAVQLQDASGRTMRGEVVVMVVNDAILQLTGYRPPNLVQTIFADQPISTRFSDNRQQVVLRTQRAAFEKGWGYGGGFLAGAGSTRVRTNFQPLAYYRVVETDANGRANVAFTLPDDLTTWRATAVALGDDDMHFGNADATFIATKPLLTNPLFPQFARPGDTVDLGLSVLAKESGNLALTGQVDGPLTFASGAPTAGSNAREIQETTAIGNTLQALRFPVLVAQSTNSSATISFTSKVGANSDAFRVPLPVRDRAVTESVIDTGTVTPSLSRGHNATNASPATVPIDFSRGGSVEITLANSVVPQFAVPGAESMAADSQPFLDDAASRLIIASTLQRLAPRYHLKLHFDPSKDAATALAAILKLQYSDGGFKSFPAETVSDPFETAYAVEAMALARRSIPSHVLEQAKAYLARTLADPARYSWCKNASCSARVRFEMLQGLEALGDHRNDFLSDVVAQRGTFDSATQIRLARYLLATPGWNSRGAAIADDATQTLYRTGRYSTVSTGDRWSWLGSTVDAQAAMVQLLVQRSAPADEIDGAVQALVAQQCKCGWPTLDETAEAMQALAAYAATEKLVPFVATVRSGSGAKKALASVRFGATASSQSVVLDTAAMNASQLVFAVTDGTQGAGTLHYVVLYTYPVAKDAPGQLAGLRVIRDVHPVGEAVALADMDLAALRDPVQAGAGNVYDIGVRVIADHPLDGVVIEDPLPAGMEAVDASFQTSSTAIVARYDSWAIDDQEIYSDRVMAYASHLEPGIYEMHYLVRTVTPGEYRWPGARAYVRSAPEQFGRTAAAVISIK